LGGGEFQDRRRDLKVVKSFSYRTADTLAVGRIV